MKIGIGILLPDDIANYVRSLELELFKITHISLGLQQEPHISIKSPFEVDSLSKYISYFDNLARCIKSFSIEVDGINYFEPAVAYLNIKSNQQLHDLHRTILDDLKKRFQIKPGIRENDEMKFHSTIAYGLNRPEFLLAKEYISQLPKPFFTFNVRSIGFFYYLGEGKGWIVIKKRQF